MQKIEAKFCTYLQKWIKYKMNYDKSFVWEAKVCRGGTFNDKQLPEHQALALRLCKKRFSYKISDFDQMQKPFDGFTMQNCEYAFVVILFNKTKRFYFIDVDNLPGHSFKQDFAEKLAVFDGVYK